MQLLIDEEDVLLWHEQEQHKIFKMLAAAKQFQLKLLIV